MYICLHVVLAPGSLRSMLKAFYGSGTKHPFLLISCAPRLIGSAVHCHTSHLCIFLKAEKFANRVIVRIPVKELPLNEICSMHCMMRNMPPSSFNAIDSSSTVWLGTMRLFFSPTRPHVPIDYVLFVLGRRRIYSRGGSKVEILWCAVYHHPVILNSFEGFLLNGQNKTNQKSKCIKYRVVSLTGCWFMLDRISDECSVRCCRVYLSAVGVLVYERKER